MSGSANLESSGSPVFWGEIAPCEHIAQFYEDDGVLLDTQAGFVGGGLKSGESAIVLATAKHLEVLEERLADSGLDGAAARAQDHYISIL
jgi:MEDS: MEthanogen/methylotroph, DcmR Sensory domain